MATDLSAFHSIWLAGLGALARIQDRDGQAEVEERVRFFEDLVRHGQALEALRQPVSSASLQELRADLDVQLQDLHKTLSQVRGRPQERLESVLESAASVGQMLTVLEEHETAKERMVEALLPTSTILSAPAVLQARRNAAAREALISEFGLLASTDVADLAGSRATNRAALANRWKQEGRLFPVSHQGQTLYPAFQLDDHGQPRPVIAEVLAAFGWQGSRDWELALWFTTASGWLGGRRPVDLLESDPAAVAQAARSEVDGLVF